MVGRRSSTNTSCRGFLLLGRRRKFLPKVNHNTQLNLAAIRGEAAMQRVTQVLSKT
jgi:hypothetical protein